MVSLKRHKTIHGNLSEVAAKRAPSPKADPPRPPTPTTPTTPAPAPTPKKVGRRPRLNISLNSGSPTTRPHKRRSSAASAQSGTPEVRVFRPSCALEDVSKWLKIYNTKGYEEDGVLPNGTKVDLDAHLASFHHHSEMGTILPKKEHKKEKKNK